MISQSTYNSRAGRARPKIGISDEYLLRGSVDTDRPDSWLGAVGTREHGRPTMP